MHQHLGLSAAIGPFAKVGLQSGVEGKFVVIVVLFCHDILLTPCPCPRPSLLVNASVAEEVGVGRWFASRDNIVATKVRFL